MLINNNVILQIAASSDSFRLYINHIKQALHLCWHTLTLLKRLIFTGLNLYTSIRVKYIK